MSFKDRLKRLEKSARREKISLRLEDGTIERFTESDFEDAFLNMIARGKAHHDGEEVPERHPFITALRSAVNVEDLVPEHGTILLMMIGEDEIHCGERERPGGTVVETSPGVYE